MIIFHFRKSDQVYVWLCRETPKTTLHVYNYVMKNLNEAFNWTMTYRYSHIAYYVIYIRNRAEKSYKHRLGLKITLVNVQYIWHFWSTYCRPMYTRIA